jgi:MYXO-CTERM domain-containing protein
MVSMQAQRFGWLVGAAALFAANAASAQDCATDADCGDGYVCKTGMTPACAEKPCPSDDPKCNDLPPDCAPMEYHYCQAKPCSDDSDCPDTMVCHSETSTECAGGSAASPPACPKDADCAQPDPQPVPQDTCKETTVSACTPRWALPCTKAADCGEGFDCKEQVSGMCSGSAPAAGGGSSGSQDGGAPAGDQALPQQTCTTEHTGQYYCELQDLPCDSNADCPSGLECIESYVGVACTGTAAAPTPEPMAGGDTPQDGAGSGSAGAGASGDKPASDCPQPDPVKVCMPPNFYGRDLGVGVADSAGGGAASGAPGADKGETQNGATPPESPAPTANGEHDSTGSGADGDSSGDDSTMESSSGCAVSAPGADQGVLGLLSMLGLSVLALRRRKA